ncbi:hypothetical protein FCL73_03485 [Mycoplasma bovis]|nr:hypothetical protein [Mycoplasmopsis bovis]MBT1335132.1 hypothetical protein [Mycoplasmopsis bovis]
MDFVFSTFPCEAVASYFNDKANGYKDELDKLTYAELIKKTVKNMADLPTRTNKNIYKSIHQENDLDKLAGYYKLSKELVDNSYEANDLWEDFLNEENIHRLDDLWRQLDIDLKTKGLGANLTLLNYIWERDADIEWIRLDEYKRPNEIRYIDDEFVDWTSRIDLENYLSAYDKDDFIDEFKLEEALEKEKLEAKKEKALVM